jgi:hypothetical protein
MDNTRPSNSTEDDTLAIEREKLVIEREKIEVEKYIEREKIEIEKYKARWTAIGVSVPILVVAATIALGVWSQYQKSRDEFTLKAAEILLAGDNPEATHNKAIALVSLFPEQLPRDFGKSFDPSQFGRNSFPAQRELVQQMAARPQDAGQILLIWKAMFPGDDWLKEFERNFSAKPIIHQAAPGSR